MIKLVTLLHLPFKTLSENLLLDTRLKGSSVGFGSSFIISFSVFPLTKTPCMLKFKNSMRQIFVVTLTERNYEPTDELEGKLEKERGKGTATPSPKIF